MQHLLKKLNVATMSRLPLMMNETTDLNLKKKNEIFYHINATLMFLHLKNCFWTG